MATTYDQIYDDIVEARKNLPKDSISVSEGSPAYEALLGAYAPQLAAIGKVPIDQTALTPEVAAQTDLQQQAATLAAQQAGLIGANQQMVFNPTTGTFDLPSDAQAGVAGYQQFLDDATTAATAAQQAALAGQTAGQTGIAASQQLANLAGAQAIAGQDAGAQFLQAAQGLTGPTAYQQFMSPYQQDVIDATMADMNQKLQEQQAQLGASAGQAFGGGRFGVAQGQLASSGAIGQALAAAQLREQGFNTAQQLAANAFQQQLAQAQAAQQQAGQNMGLLGTAQQSQLTGSQAEQQQLASTLSNLTGVGTTQQQLASLQPTLAAQQLGQIGQMGAQQQAQAQTVLDTARAARKQIAYEPYERLSFFGQQLTGIKGGYPGATYSSAPQSGTSPTAGILGLLTGGASLATGIAGLMGNNQPQFMLPGQ
mgnify:FL=1|tara:strand:+ start:499 stop:1773 length:1275 start_codon:yes stop_codon:yes gene_type:complete